MVNWIRLIQLAVGRVGDGSSNSPNGESDLVHPSRPTASRIDWSDSPLGELGVACPFYLATGRPIPGFVASMLGNSPFQGLNDPLRGACRVMTI
ncbi:hypothetical protein F2Q70_00038363 [Brassica cretica]|uniref:Uncharacterized protein n=2 Tax=Brassica cretica TaxID=69181 RepID=A0A3N6QQU0_BRACR|nr:hypothetical protein F2Q70_00038363 [Brassica cretica]KAF2619319.1 hypothetical protein F2Q68_00038976 [Brassica cretica]KAF3495192.1 hypothetical protein DY000_02052547 [Brassica cretica]